MRRKDLSPTGPTITNGVSLRESEWQDLEEIAKEFEITEHAIRAYAIRYFLRQFKNGVIHAEVKQQLPRLS